MYRCVIIEDEVKAREVLERYLDKVPNLKLEGYFADGVEALTGIRELNPDVLFLDINMPGLNGMELLSLIQEDCQVIITTAYSEYALKSYDFEVVDYLLKPIAFTKFMRAISRLQPKSSKIPNDSSFELTDVITLKSGQKIYRIPTDQIQYLAKDGNYLDVHMEDGKKVVVRMSMNDALRQFAKASFVRVHRSFVVNVERVKYLENSTIFLQDGQKVAVGSKYKDELMKRLL